MSLVKADEGADVDIADAITVGEAEALFVLQETTDPSQAAAGLGMFAGVHQGDAPGFGVALEDVDVVGAEIDGEVGVVEQVVGEIFLDQIALVAQADDEVIDAMVGIGLEDVPEDGLATDLDHGLGLDQGFFGEPGAQAAGQDDCLQSRTLCAQQGLKPGDFSQVTEKLRVVMSGCRGNTVELLARISPEVSVSSVEVPVSSVIGAPPGHPPGDLGSNA